MDIKTIFQIDNIEDLKYSWPSDIDIIAGRSIISFDEANEYNYEVIESLQTIKYFLSPLFIKFIPKDLSILPNQYFKLINDIFLNKFSIDIDDILSLTINDDYDSLSYREEIINFLKYLHTEIPQLKNINDIYEGLYGNRFKQISNIYVKKIYNFFKNLIVA